MIFRNLTKELRAKDLVAQARSNSGLNDVEALAVAVEETRAHRSGQ